MAKSRKRKKKKSSAAKNVAIFFIVFTLLVGLLIFGLKQVFKDDDSVATLAGYSFFIMDSDNMGQDCPKDSLVIAVNGVPSSEKCGFTVLARNVEGQGTTVGWLYEVGAKGDTVDHVVYTIYQEKAPDKMYDLKSADILGQATSYYLTAGKIISFMITPFGMAVCIAAPLVLMILILLIIAMANRSGDGYDLDDFEEMERRHDAQQNSNMSLDDFLYGGEGDEVYASGSKPSADYGEEFDEKYGSTVPEPAMPAPQGDPFFGLGEEEPAEAEAPQNAEEPAFEEPEPEPAPAPAPVEDEPPVIPHELFAHKEKAPEPQPQPESAPAPAVSEPAPAKPAVDPSYYERASKMIDDAVSQGSEAPAAVETSAPAPSEDAVYEEPAQRPQRPQRPAQGQPRRRPPQRPAGAPPRRRPPQARPPRREAPSGKSSADTIDELMKLMEEEQKKLRSNKD